MAIKGKAPQITGWVEFHLPGRPALGFTITDDMSEETFRALMRAVTNSAVCLVFP